jgi:hypothetical protein
VRGRRFQFSRGAEQGVSQHWLRSQHREQFGESGLLVLLDLYHKARSDERVEFPYQTPEEVTPIVYVNRILREFTHIFIYDEETVRLMMGPDGLCEHSARVL